MANAKDGSHISLLRRQLGMTQEEFAHALGVTVSTVNRWENGHIEPSRLARRALRDLEARLGARAGSESSAAGTGAPTPLMARAG